MFMNKQECEVLKQIFLSSSAVQQRIIAEASGYSLGAVNHSVKALIAGGYLTDDIHITERARELFRSGRPKRAIILAAGFGMRMIPINTETPKAFLEVGGEMLIERQIKHLHEAGVTDICIVVGFMKEHFEYLIDKYGVKLIVNADYASKNNLYSMKLAEKYLSDSYIIPCDIWCANNPFDRYELYSWYMVSDSADGGSDVRVNRKSELVRTDGRTDGNAMIGIAYITEDDAIMIRERIRQLSADSANDECFWEEALYSGKKMTVAAKVVHFSEAVEINTYEQLRDLDEDSNNLQSDSLDVIAEVLDASVNDITNIEVLKKGMTNRSFLFSCKNSKYIMRIPGEGTNRFINRRHEAEVYRVICGKGLCDDVVYIDSEKGYKITRFLNDVRVCDKDNEDDLKKCMNKLRQFHNMKLTVEHEFDIFEQIEFYEALWEGAESVYKDYRITKENVFSLKKYIDRLDIEKVLTHIDAVPDNFLFAENDDGEEELQLTDWEYAGMQDPHVDIAMFCIYSLYEREKADRLIDIYFEDNCSAETRIKIYCYIAACGLLWSNWCEYKCQLGVEFGEYSLRQYRYAKDYYRIVKELLSDV